jgi:hypothetical protein
MRWVWSIQRADGSFPNIGMNRRGLIRGNRNKAARHAIDLANHYKASVKMEGWQDWNFYKNDKPDTEFITVLG